MPGHSTNLGTLRRRRIYIHRQLDRYEPLVAALRANLAACNAAIQAICPELPLPPQRRKPNPHFKAGELPRIVLRLLREANRPLAVRELALRALAVKGVIYPDRHTLKRARGRVKMVCRGFEMRGVVRKVGSGNKVKRELAAGSE